MKTDWEHTRPPQLVMIDAMVKGEMRKGYVHGGWLYLLEPNASPAANGVLSDRDIDAWRSRGEKLDTAVLDRHSKYSLQNTRVDMRMGSAVVAGAVSSLFGW